MVTQIRLIGITLAVAAGIGGFGFLSGGDSAPAMAAPAATAQPAIPAVSVSNPAPAASVQDTAAKPAVDCAKQAWPYVARECLSAVEGTPTRTVTRVVTTTAR